MPTGRLALITLVAALTAPPLAAQAERRPGAPDTAGFIHGTVTMRGGNSYTGLLRWGREEAFWGDHFNSSKESNEHWRHVPRSARSRRDQVEVFGVRVGIRRDRHWEPTRQFVARFGDIRSIELRGSEDARVTMKSGSVFDVSGGSNDVGAEITVWDASLGTLKLPWKKIERIEFSPAPAGVRPYAERISARVETRAGTFSGYLQWDSEECVSTDTLEGDSEDGRMSIELGRIRVVERDGRRGSRLTLADGRVLRLRGTNDVDESIRGILVEDPRYGRVKISWDAFEKAELRRGDSGPSYAEFPATAPLSGSVLAADDTTSRGRIVFDVDEAEGWEILHGDAAGVEYLIPFSLVASIEPRGPRGSVVTLAGGEELRLEESQDVSSRNDGVLIFASERGEPAYLPWAEVRRIDFSRR